MKINNSIILLAVIALIIVWGCEKDVMTSIGNDQQVSIRNPENGVVNGKSGGSKGKPPGKGKFLGPWGEPDGLLHVYGVFPDSPSESAAQDFPCDFRKAKQITSIFARLARTGNPNDAYFMTLRTGLDGTILARTIDVPVANVISEDSIFALGEWIEFPLQAPYLMEAGDYFVQMERTGPGDNQNYVNWFTDWQNPLPDHAGWVRSAEWGWQMYDPILSDEFLIMLSYR
jgi:hypothetical protein